MKFIQEMNTQQEHDRAVTFIRNMIFGAGRDAFSVREMYLLWGLLPPGDIVLINEDNSVRCLVSVTDGSISLDYDFKGDVPDNAAMLNFYRPPFAVTNGKPTYRERGFVFPYHKGGSNATEKDNQ